MKKYKNILITGGTGSFGKNCAYYLLNKYKTINKLVLFSRDELKQSELKKKFSKYKWFNKLRFFIGDVRDYKRLEIAFKDIDLVIHSAALKQVDTAEYNPYEFIQTNILGAQNVVYASTYNKVKKVIALSTDKASSPINLYGATKLCSDKLFISSNNFFGKRQFVVVRYGNVAGSRGSVLPLFIDQAKKNEFTVTDPKMTRFNISLERGIKTVEWTVNNCLGGEIVVPKIKSYKILDVINSFSNKPKIKTIGIRFGEKIHEEMISIHDSKNTYKIGDYYVILPHGDKKILNFYRSKTKSKKVESNFSYTSDGNKEFMTISEIKKTVNEIVKKII
jgi:UDP-N-acetylglucosamine 4,6-dehydratase/5-epimerase